MPMTVIVTRDIPDRFRGFLASVALEISPGVYTAPEMTAAIRDRVWRVLEDWHRAFAQGSIVMTWPDGTAPGAQRVLTLGEPPRELWDCGGIVLARRDIASEISGAKPSASLKTE